MANPPKPENMTRIEEIVERLSAKLVDVATCRDVLEEAYQEAGRLENEGYRADGIVLITRVRALAFDRGLVQSDPEG